LTILATTAGPEMSLAGWFCLHSAVHFLSLLKVVAGQSSKKTDYFWFPTMQADKNGV
jgi:hypothetical protein